MKSEPISLEADPVIDAYKRDVDRTLLRENLKLTPEDRLRKLQDFVRRGAPPGLPFAFDVDTIRRGLNFTLTTTVGDIDLLGEVAGGGSYDELLPQSDSVPLLGHSCRCVTLDTLIRLKRAAGRPKDLEAIAELEALREERGPSS